MCASSYLRFLSQISTSSLSSSGLHILRPHLVFTRSDLHRRVTLSLSYHLQDFTMQLLSQLYNLIYLRLQNFISPRSRANRRLVLCLRISFPDHPKSNCQINASLKSSFLLLVSWAWLLDLNLTLVMRFETISTGRFKALGAWKLRFG